MIKEKIEFYHEQNLPIHVSLKGKFFRRGKVTDTNENYFILNDLRLGKQHIFYEDVVKVQELIPLRKRKKFSREVKDGAETTN